MTIHTKEGYATINGINMYYQLFGEGQKLVLVHGGGSTIQTNFGYIIPLLSQHFQILAMELQAHGHSSDRNAPESFQQDADDVAALMDHLQWKGASVFGFSNGGNTSMQLAIRYPEKVKKLVLASTFYKREGLLPGFFEGMKSASLENMPLPLQTAFLEINNNRDALQNMHDKDKQRMLDFSDWSEEDLRSIAVPVLLISADQDVIRPEHTVEMSRKMPNARLMIVPGNHGSYIGEICTPARDEMAIGLVIGIVEQFLKQNDSNKI
ncbi:MAG: alpha/beta fold hydrolase [Flavisolibacter sp.]